MSYEKIWSIHWLDYRIIESLELKIANIQIWSQLALYFLPIVIFYEHFWCVYRAIECDENYKLSPDIY